MRRLTGDLDALARETGEPVTVVFDGAPRETGGDRVQVRFARRRGPNAADDDIAALAAADDDPTSLRVVTSDAGLADRVRPTGAGLVGAGEFRRRLDALAAPDREDPSGAARSSDP